MKFIFLAAVMELDRNDFISLGMSARLETTLFFLCHALGMSSTITNPILYGWLNTNLKHLFRAMIPHVKANERRTSAFPDHHNQNLQQEQQQQQHAGMIRCNVEMKLIEAPELHAPPQVVKNVAKINGVPV